MKTHCAIQEDFCPRELTICCLECKYSKTEKCDADCMNHFAKCGLGGIVKADKKGDK